MPRRTRLLDTLKGKGHILERQNRLGDAYYSIRVIEEFVEARGAPIPESETRKYEGTIDFSGSQRLELGGEYILVLDDGSRLKFLVQKRTATPKDVGQYRVVGQGGPF